MNNKEMREMENNEIDNSERCSSTSMMRREAKAEPSNQDVAEPDQIASGAAGTGQKNEEENEELEWMKEKEVKPLAAEGGAIGQKADKSDAPPVTRKAPRLARRVTALRGREINSRQRPKRSVLSRIERELLAYDSDVPYAVVEKAQRDLVCSLIERQDRMTEQLFVMINELQYRTDDLELAVEAVLKKKTGIPSSPDRAGMGGSATGSTGREQP